MPSKSAPKVNAREARRDAALSQIVNGMAGAFGDYVRSQMAQRASQVQPLMQARGPAPMAAPPPPEYGMGAAMGAMAPSSGWVPPVGDGTAGPSFPITAPPIMGPGGIPIPPQAEQAGNRNNPTPWGTDPGFVPPVTPGVDLPPLMFEDGSSAPRPLDPSFGSWPNPFLNTLQFPPHLLAYLDAIRAMGGTPPILTPRGTPGQGL